ncbi:MAG: adenylate/guanylate cyclase domain-containing protein [Spirochaetales bacterium]|nr:adenylate/guanylate cyclase domain-containing protein [Spirochaetales bacterium]
MASLSERILGKKVAGTRVVPLMLKIVTVFTIFLVVSNISTNYINLSLNQAEQIRLLNRLLIADLSDIHIFASNQYDIFQFNQDLPAAKENIRASAAKQLEGVYSLALGVYPDGSLFMEAGSGESTARSQSGQFTDLESIQTMNRNLEQGLSDGLFRFAFEGRNYIGVYKYQPSWGVFFIRAEDQQEFYADSVRIFQQVLLIIGFISLLTLVLGILILRRILRFVGLITSQIMAMQERQNMELVDMKDAPNDEVAYLGIAFNSLASTIENLLTIFKKFVARDVAQRAYREREIRLEGTKRELAILFTDIKGFTFMTEVLGTEIITLLNLHYEEAIRHIHENNGDIGSIIGDALLAVFGVIGRPNENKYYQAIKSGYEVVSVAAKLREQMHKRREKILKDRGALTPSEEKVFKAVLIEVGVGIDGGEVFYGNIGSTERMVNTVIGDNVNSASRLEGLTRVYRVPVIVSEFVKENVERDFDNFYFLELDQVQVKGKTIGKRIFWPLDLRKMDPEFKERCDIYTEALKAYYDGDWPKAHEYFTKSALPQADVFIERTRGKTAPMGWSGIWTMTEK